LKIRVGQRKRHNIMRISGFLLCAAGVFAAGQALAKLNKVQPRLLAIDFAAYYTGQRDAGRALNYGPDGGQFFAQGYLTAVRAVFSEVTWCLSSVSAEPDPRLLRALKQQRAGSDFKNASAVIIEVMQDQYACPPPSPDIADSVSARLSVRALIADYNGDRSVSQMLQDEAHRNRQRYATGYIAGVGDSAEGRLWCYSGSIKPDELDARIVGELENLEPAAMQADAATRVLASLQRRFPCHRQPAKEKK
jgi:hypothetical protein